MFAVNEEDEAELKILIQELKKVDQEKLTKAQKSQVKDILILLKKAQEVAKNDRHNMEAFLNYLKAMAPYVEILKIIGPIGLHILGFVKGHISFT